MTVVVDQPVGALSFVTGADVSAEIERDLCLIANAGAEAVYLDSRMFLPENTFIGSSFGKV